MFCMQPILESVTPNGWDEDLAQYTDEVNLHAKALDGKIANFTGVSSPYEAPQNAELVIPTHGRDPADGAHAIVDELMKRVCRLLDMEAGVTGG